MSGSSYSRIPYLIVHREKQIRKDVYGSVDDAVVLQAQLIKGERASKTALVAMHPIGAPAYLPFFSELARRGHHVIACTTRYVSGDYSLQMENAVLDVAACVRDARERLGYQRVVLIGWSGGGALLAGFQAEAEHPVIQTTAAGEDTPLAGASLIPGDALILIASHRSRHRLLTGQLDASISDEGNPEDRNSALDLYNPAESPRPPYSVDFLEAYRQAQIMRCRRISAWAKDRLAALKKAGRNHTEHCFVVYGTMADPRWIDPAIEPNDRRPNWTYMGDPEMVNNSPSGLGRYTSLRSWLSQWSFDDAQFDTVDSGARITVPSLIVAASADDACPVSHTDAMYKALGSADKKCYTVSGANHYFNGPDGRQHLGEAMSLIDRWLAERGLLPDGVSVQGATSTA